VASWTNDSPLAPEQVAPPRFPLISHPVQLVMLSVVISVIITLGLCRLILEAVFVWGWHIPLIS
jgi:hypothetical protein